MHGYCIYLLVPRLFICFIQLKKGLQKSLNREWGSGEAIVCSCADYRASEDWCGLLHSLILNIAMGYYVTLQRMPLMAWLSWIVSCSERSALGIDGDRVLFLSRTGRLTFSGSFGNYLKIETRVWESSFREPVRGTLCAETAADNVARRGRKGGSDRHVCLDSSSSWLIRSRVKKINQPQPINAVKHKDFVAHMFISVYRVFIFRSRTDQNKRGGQTRVQRTLRHSHIET